MVVVALNKTKSCNNKFRGEAYGLFLSYPRD